MRISSMAIGVTLSGLLLGACSAKHNEATGSSTAVSTTATPALGGATMPKPGLWSMTVSAEGMPKPMQMRICVGAPAPGTNPFAPPPQAGQDCTKNAFAKTATGYSIEIECKMNGMAMHTKGDVSGDFSSSYTTTMKTKMSGPGIPAAMQTERTSTAVAKYVGACPTDMKPGSAKQAG